MSKKIVAIGGGENGRIMEDGNYAPYETETIDKEIIRLTKKEKPNFLFLAHSQSASIEIQESYYQTMKNIYGKKFGCNCKDLKSNELKDIEKVKEKIDWADIIYEGGGDTFDMIKLWYDTNFDKILYNAWNNGKVICGVSAGACCWFKSCNSDSINIENGQMQFTNVDCLNWINAYFTPHCDEPGRQDTTKNQLKENNLVGIMLSNCAALEIIDNQYRIIVSEPKCHKIKRGYGLKAYWNKNTYKEEEINISNRFENISKLLNKEMIFEFDDER